MSDETPRSQWEDLAAKELRGTPLNDLTWMSPEGIEVKPLYTESDLDAISHLSSFPGLEPFVRGPRATMYTLSLIHI